MAVVDFAGFFVCLFVRSEANAKISIEIKLSMAAAWAFQCKNFSLELNERKWVMLTLV